MIPATVGEMMDYLSQFDRSDKLWVLSQRPKPKPEPEVSAE